jgi:hypothetical protein
VFVTVFNFYYTQKKTGLQENLKSFRKQKMGNHIVAKEWPLDDSSALIQIGFVSDTSCVVSIAVPHQTYIEPKLTSIQSMLADKSLCHRAMSDHPGGFVKIEPHVKTLYAKAPSLAYLKILSGILKLYCCVLYNVVDR